MRNRVKILDLGFLLVMAAATLFAFEIDVFSNDATVPQRQATIEVDELMALTTLFVVGVLIFTWWRGSVRNFVCGVA